MDTKKILPTKEFQYSSEAKEYMNQLLSKLLKQTLTVTTGKDLVANLPKILPYNIAIGAQLTVNDSIKEKKNILSIDKLLSQRDAKSMPKEDKRNISYLLEYIAFEILDLAVNCCRDNKKKRISKAHIEYVIKNDPELSMMFLPKSKKNTPSPSKSI
jgi:hypothetical protein